MTPSPQYRIFYDGTCGLCHRFVVFTLKWMDGEPFIFSSQEGEAFQKIKKLVPNLLSGDSIVFFDESQKSIFVKGEVIRKVLLQLKWPWRGVGLILKCVPNVILNCSYDLIARARHRFFEKPQKACPIVPKCWLKYFEE